MPQGFEEIQRQELSRLFGRMAGVRLAFIPAAALLTAYVVIFEPARWRAALLAAVLAPLVVFFVVERVRFRRAGLSRRAVPVNLLAALVGQTALALATGALESPFTYAFVPLAIMIGVFASPGAHRSLVLAQLAATWALLAVELSGTVADLNPAAFGGGARAGHGDAHLVASAAVLSLVLALGSRAGRAVRQVFDRMLREALRAREESLRAHADRAEELTALSAEIAHELKNPLASVKGLATLLADGVPPGKPAERLGVLRREVDRMQGVLEEFLNFSRPLVPLTARPVDLAALARDVAALHEGMARQRGVAVEVRGGGAEARCDARKVKQILMNLLQNALEASPAGAAVEVQVARERDRVAVVLLDRGGGLDAAVAERAFEPGVTTKDRGSGLGLTIARALARQHGGEVELAARPGGGCAAALRLPGLLAVPSPGEPEREVAR